MLRRIAHTRALRPSIRPRHQHQHHPQQRLYTTKPDVEPAEFSANKSTSSTIKYIAAGATVLALGLYGTMAGNPRDVAKVGLESDPQAVKEFIPPHGGREASPKKG
ncbi:hypothetical protein E4U21_005261 [Claviceps maximensis]|nr:hypothetical protein E4U21_005261 [Claviceps maximensis]